MARNWRKKAKFGLKANGHDTRVELLFIKQISIRKEEVSRIHTQKSPDKSTPRECKDLKSTQREEIMASDFVKNGEYTVTFGDFETEQDSG
ncbi:Protein of unknown function [Cotesia congregata]|uniref:Uncharacterized protein n=1 Tax=Cotesia congregata TaxID=51543 RepID=A0A8J2MJB7_COTCN|nr:Protein of unknown function [Cotesia congregata]